MEDKNFVMYPAKTVDDAVALLKNISGIQLLAGATQTREIKSDFFTVRNIEEMCAIDRRERYIDVGAAVPLSALSELGSPRIPSVLADAISTIAHKYGIPVLIDNTFATPFLFRPIEHGADVVIHSATKFLGGHGRADVQNFRVPAKILAHQNPHSA